MRARSSTMRATSFGQSPIFSGAAATLLSSSLTAGVRDFGFFRSELEPEEHPQRECPDQRRARFLAAQCETNRCSEKYGRNRMLPDGLFSPTPGTDRFDPLIYLGQVLPEIGRRFFELRLKS